MRSHLSRHMVKEPLSDEEMEPMRKRAWREQQVVMVRPSEILDEWFRQALINYAQERWG